MLSVVMSVYNESIEEIQKSILSILNQTYKKFEFIIIIDNPNNLEIINTIKFFANKDKRIKYIINEKNIGLALSLNKGIEIAKGDYIARMDADDISLQNRFEEQIKYLEENTNISLLGSFAKIIDTNDVIFSELCPEFKFENIKRKMKYISCFIHPTVIFKKEVFEKLNGYRNFPCAQDYDFFSRILDAGYEVSNLPKFLLFYRMRNNNLTSKKGLLQILLSEYIQKLSKERQKYNGKDHFNIKDIKAIESLFEKEKNNFNKAKEIINKYKNNRIFLFFVLPKILYISKYHFIIIKNKIFLTIYNIKNIFRFYK